MTNGRENTVASGCGETVFMKTDKGFTSWLSALLWHFPVVPKWAVPALCACSAFSSICWGKRPERVSARYSVLLLSQPGATVDTLNAACKRLTLMFHMFFIYLQTNPQVVTHVKWRL